MQGFRVFVIAIWVLLLAVSWRAVAELGLAGGNVRRPGKCLYRRTLPSRLARHCSRPFARRGVRSPPKGGP